MKSLARKNLVTNQVELIYSNDLTKVWDGFDNGYGPTFLIYYMGESLPTQNLIFIALMLWKSLDLIRSMI